jgi:gliding motility-associated lipoprotein GldD
MSKITMVSILSFFLAIISCQPPEGMPRPRAYPRIEFPDHQYETYSTVDCPFTFRYPAHAEIRDKDESCWFDIYMPRFEARIHCSYVPVNNRAKYNDLVRDAFVIANKINERANYMEEMRISNAQGVGGLSLAFSGPAASPFHYFLTDTTQHFFKAALYFDAKVQPDSLAPIVAFIQKDIEEMIATFSWK